MHSSQTNHSIIPLSSVDAIHFPSKLSKTPLLSLPLSLSLSLTPFALHLFAVLSHSVSCCRCHRPPPCAACRPTYCRRQRGGALTRGTQLQTRDEDHATLCDPLAVAAGDAVCASPAFSITAPPPTAHTTHSAAQQIGARWPAPAFK